MIRLTFSRWGSLDQSQIDWLLGQRISVQAMIRPQAILAAIGLKASDGRFEETLDGLPWLVFEETEDEVFWNPRSTDFATSDGRAFALGQEVIDNPGTYSFDCNLNIFSNPLDWLRAKRDGCVIIDWSRAFDRLRDCPRIAIAEEVLPHYRRHMQPRHMPETFVIPRRKAAA